jgi:hypothetical protein
MSTIEYKDIKVPQEIDKVRFNEISAGPTSPSALIGKQLDRVNAVLTQTFEDTTVEGTKEKAVTTYGDNFDLFRMGKDIKTIQHFARNSLLSPNITLGRERIADGDNLFDNTIESYNFGQNKSFKTSTDSTNVLIPFDDFEGKPEPASFLNKAQGRISGYPYVYQTLKSFGQYMNPEVASIDGAIDVFHVRSSHISSGINDMYIRGAKGLFGAGNWILTQNTTYGKKGSSFLDNIYSIDETQHDFYEDSQNTVLTKPVGGYVSEGVYKNSPFIEDDEFTNHYDHLTISQRTTLLVSSSRNDSEIGTRFKSKQNGFMITPFYQINEQRSFGVDSISFSGLLKR